MLEIAQSATDCRNIEDVHGTEAHRCFKVDLRRSMDTHDGSWHWYWWMIFMPGFDDILFLFNVRSLSELETFARLQTLNQSMNQKKTIGRFCSDDLRIFGMIYVSESLFLLRNDAIQFLEDTYRIRITSKWNFGVLQSDRWTHSSKHKWLFKKKLLVLIFQSINSLML